MDFPSGGRGGIQQPLMVEKERASVEEREEKYMDDTRAREEMYVVTSWGAFFMVRANNMQPYTNRVEA